LSLVKRARFLLVNRAGLGDADLRAYVRSLAEGLLAARREAAE
jgi:hypothetical protein